MRVFLLLEIPRKHMETKVRETPYKWLVCAAATLLCMCSISIPAGGFGVYLPFMRDLYGYSNTMTTLFATVRQGASFLTMFAFVLFYEKFNIRLGGFLSICCVSVFLGIMSFFGHIYPMCLVAEVFGGMSYSLGSVTACSLIINRWFMKNRGLALGICSAGTGLVTFVVPQTATRLITAAAENGTIEGLKRAQFVEMIAVLAVGVFYLLVVRNEPSTGSLENMTVKKATKEDPYPNRTNVSHRTTVIMVIAIALFAAYVQAGYGNLSLLFRTAGYDPKVTANALSTAGLIFLVAKPMLGVMMDRFGNFWSTVITFAVYLIAAAMFANANSLIPWLPMASIGIYSIGVGISTMGPPAWAKDFYRPEEYMKRARDYYMAYTAGSFLFSFYPGIIADATGSYVPAFASYFAMMVFIAIVVLGIYIRRHMTKTPAKALAESAS